jgi:sugar phosphate isomerase/epimerase
MQLVMFSKMLQELDVGAAGDAVRSIGFDGIDLTVRSGGHVLPERVTRDLPAAVNVLREKSLTVPMLTTEITSSASPNAEEIIATAASLGITLLKLGYWQYKGFGELSNQLDDARADLESLAPLARRHGVTLCLHCHSGDYLTATPGLIYLLLADREPEYFGAYADLGHMTVEGGRSGWKLGLDLLSSRIRIVSVKGMGWRYEPGFAGARGSWQNIMLPLESSAVRWEEAFAFLNGIGFDGPVSFHSEYMGGHSWRPMTGVDEILAQTRADFAYLSPIIRGER